MRKPKLKLAVKKPKSFLTKPLTADFKELFKALSKGIAHSATGKWEELGTDTAEALSAIGLTTDAEELAFLLIRRALTKALFDLVGECATMFLEDTKVNRAELCDQLDTTILEQPVYIDKSFLDCPTEIQLLKDVQPLLASWLQVNGIPVQSIQAIIERFPSYFVYALNDEWRRNVKVYHPITEALSTPFTRAGEREWGWKNYGTLLQRRVAESIFDEPFSLSQLYVPLNGYYLEEVSRKRDGGHLAEDARKYRRVVVSLEDELLEWLGKADAQDAIRVISGGPGSGKSCFARMFVAKVAEKQKVRPLYIPLHLIDATKDLVDEVGRFVRDEGVLPQNPLTTDSPERNLLIVFDGLDELASQGKASAETARAFVREVEKTVEKRNFNLVRLRVLISGRELLIQENESEFRRPRQVLNLLPYFMQDRHHAYNEEHYHDPRKLLRQDLRQVWWRKYGSLSGRSIDGMPKELNRRDLDEVTAQPLLNYLVALSFTRGALDFRKDVNLNSIYEDLVEAVHDRGYEKHRRFVPIRHMSLDNFARVLEEIGLAAWHGDGRTTTVREIEDHCTNSGVGGLLSAFQEGAKAGVTRLLAAFFFRQYGQRPSGDPTFIFTHKSFGEYLTARRVVRGIERIVRELDRRSTSPDEGWDERDALKHWGQICGPSAVSPYLHEFLGNEMRLKPPAEVTKWQTSLTHLFSFMLRNGMPMEQLQLSIFRDQLFQSRNAEETLLVMLNACARITDQISEIQHPTPTTFWTWFKRIQGQRSSGDSCLAASCLSYLNLSRTVFHMADLYDAKLCKSNLTYSKGVYACLLQADLSNSVCKNAELIYANLDGSDLRGVDLTEANLRGATIRRANFEGAVLKGARIDHIKAGGAALRRLQARGKRVVDVDS